MGLGVHRLGSELARPGSSTTVRWMLIILMVLGLLMSTSIPKAFGDRALLFVSAYVAMQVGRAIF